MCLSKLRANFHWCISVLNNNNDIYDAPDLSRNTTAIGASCTSTKYISTPTLTPLDTHTHALLHAPTRARAHAHKHTHTHTHSYTHTHTHTHTHTLFLSVSVCLSVCLSLSLSLSHTHTHTHTHLDHSFLLPLSR